MSIDAPATNIMKMASDYIEKRTDAPTTATRLHEAFLDLQKSGQLNQVIAEMKGHNSVPDSLPHVDITMRDDREPTISFSSGMFEHGADTARAIYVYQHPNDFEVNPDVDGVKEAENYSRQFRGGLFSSPRLDPSLSYAPQ